MKRAPSFRNSPSQMNPKAEDLWREILKKYADDIYESKSMRDQWRKAKSHFERVCKLRKVAPYVQEETLLNIATRLAKLTRSF